MGILKILRASAGSGKTHRLTNEYIRLMLSTKEAYRHVLAVTFTNKATEEMKGRILEELFKRSLTDDLVKERLITVLHDYSSFNISTIDKFFQTTLRAFARESGINSSYGIELDDKMVVREAVDRVIDNLDDPANEELLQWFVDFSLKMVDDGKNWDIRRIIDNKINNFTKESYKSVRRDLFINVNRSVLEDFIKDLDRITTGFEKELLEIASEAERILDRNNLTFDNFRGGSQSSFKYFIKLSEGKTDMYSDAFAALADNFEKWVTRVMTKTSPSIYHSIENAYSDGLNDLICRLVYSEEKWREYYSAVVVKEQIYMLGVLLEINQEINSYSREKNILLLSETNDLLNRIINGDDAPFIYEKVGSRTDHFLLDEFQDTSKLQWDNFKPLIANSLSQGYENLLVGDVKQSIYRWRGSDWKILSEGVAEAFPGAGLKTEELQENWRSGDEIISFNTEFFTFASDQCATLTENGDKLAGSVYSQSAQTPAKDKKVKNGHVSVQFISNDESRKWREKLFDYLPETIEALLSKGFTYRDITFLVRQNKEGTAVAEWLIENGYPVISEESLLLVLSPAVRKLISLLKFFNNPDRPHQQNYC